MQESIMHVRLCVHTHMYIHIHTCDRYYRTSCMYEYAYICMLIHAYMYTQKPMRFDGCECVEYSRIHTSYIHTCMHTCDIDIRWSIHTYMNEICIHTYIRWSMHTYIFRGACGYFTDSQVLYVDFSSGEDIYTQIYIYIYIYIYTDIYIYIYTCI